jgi:hypothetical protein
VVVEPQLLPQLLKPQTAFKIQKAKPRASLERELVLQVFGMAEAINLFAQCTELPLDLKGDFNLR